MGKSKSDRYKDRKDQRRQSHRFDNEDYEDETSFDKQDRRFETSSKKNK